MKTFITGRKGFAGILAILALFGIVLFGSASLNAAEQAKTEAQVVKEVAKVLDAPHQTPAHATEPPTLIKKFAYSYLTAFMFFLSLALGAFVLVLFHHLFDAGWSVGIRRYLEHMACLVRVLAVLFIPILLLAKEIYPWMNIDPAQDHSLQVKRVLFNIPTFYGVSIGLFVIWTFFTMSLRRWSIKQDETGAPECTFWMRRLSAAGIFVFAFSLTLASIFWMKSLQHQFFSTMYGVYYFAGSVWVTLATAYVIGLKLKQNGTLKILHKRQFHDLGVLLMVFTVFYAYIHFSQYFLIWNAAIPEETFWYVLREKGTWWQVGLIILFGHFLVPFILLLRIDMKLKPAVMVPLAAWAWLMHYIDMTFNIMPVLYPDGIHPHIFDIISLAIIGGTCYFVFKRDLAKYAPYPLRDPRLKEAVTFHEVPPANPTSIATH